MKTEFTFLFYIIFTNIIRTINSVKSSCSNFECLNQNSFNSLNILITLIMNDSHYRNFFFVFKCVLLDQVT